jgi:carboxyl-terminal processing protease
MPAQKKSPREIEIAPELSPQVAPEVAPAPATAELAAADGASASHRQARGRRRIDTARLSMLLVAAMAGAALFVGGYSLGARVSTTPGTPASEEQRFAPFWDTYSLIQQQYAGSPRPSQDQLVRGAIKGMLESLGDPFSYYENPQDFANSVLNVGGQAVGIGVTAQLQPVKVGGADCDTAGADCEFAIASVIADSPAEAAGLEAGDVVTRIDGNAFDGLDSDHIIALIRGTKDTTVKLSIVRGDRSFDVSIVRRVFNRPEIDKKVMANGAVQYIQVIGINPPASSQFDLAVSEAVAAGRKSIIVDLRGNGGGYVPDAVKIASEFIPSGTILYQQDARGHEESINANSGGHATDPSIKVVVLVDKNTASSSEILAGALQSYSRAKLVGTVTYGKGIVQEWLPLPNNAGGIHLTVARWLTPDRVWIQNKGLQPDVAATNEGARAGTDPILDAGLAALGYPPEPTASASPTPAGASASPAPSLTPAPSGSR